MHFGSIPFEAGSLVTWLLMPSLNWIGKEAVLNHHREVPYRLLKCESDLSNGSPGSGNLLVEGDNLEALKALLPYYKCMDESGHDHKSAPYEVRGGICVHVSKVWALTQKIKGLEYFCFGDHLHHYKADDKETAPELKGKKLLKTKKFTLAHQSERLFPDADRQELCRKLLAKGVRKEPPTRDELTALGQASLRFVDELLRILLEHDVVIFASRIPRGIERPKHSTGDIVRKDQFFLLERYHRFLRAQGEMGILILDESDKDLDRRYVSSLERLVRHHETAKGFVTTIVPSPFFVASEMSYLIQAADIILYVLNWGFRVSSNAPAPARIELEQLDGGRIRKMIDDRRVSAGKRQFYNHSVFDVNEPWESKGTKKVGNAFGAVFRARQGRASKKDITPKAAEK